MYSFPSLEPASCSISSWQPARDGDPELLLRQKIEAAAKKSELKLNNLGTVRLTRINQDFGFAELDISATTRLSQLAPFMARTNSQKAWLVMVRYLPTS